jgi:hypothetical protein
MYKDEEIIAINSRVSTKRNGDRYTKNGFDRKENGKISQIGKWNGIKKEETLQKREINIPAIHGSIPAIKCVIQVKPQTDFINFFRNHNIRFSKYLKYVNVLFPEHSFKHETTDRLYIETQNLFQSIFNNPKIEFDSDNFIIWESSFQFKYVYAFIIDDIYDYNELSKKILFSFLKSLTEFISIPFLDDDFDYYKNIIDENYDVYENESDEDNEAPLDKHINEFNELQTANENYDLYYHYSNSFDIHVVKDYKWVADYFLYSGYENVAKRIIEIGEIVKEIKPNFQDLVWDENDSVEFIVFTTLPYDLANNLMIEGMCENAGNTCLAPLHEIGVHLDRENHFDYSLDCYYISIILEHITEIFYRPLDSVKK